jgi:hypothetical protein
MPEIPYKIDENIVDEIQTHYSRILDQAGLNVTDPIAANVGFFNTHGKLLVDRPGISKTAVFITRPNLNFATVRNITRSKLFSYYKQSPLGCGLMRQLTYGKTADMMYYSRYGDKSQHVPVLGITNGYDMNIGGDIVSDYIESIPLTHTNFNTLLSNTCTEVNNAKDLSLEVYETKGNFSGSKLAYAKGLDNVLSTGEITLTFDDIYFSPVLIEFYIWLMYMHYVTRGMVRPHYQYIINRIIDYTCSIYVFMLATDGQTIVRWCRYTGCFPINLPFSQINHNTSQINQEGLHQIAVNFKYNFMSPMDPMALSEFNMISGPSIYDRLLIDYQDNNARITNALIGTHYLTLNNMYYLTTEYKPKYRGLNEAGDKTMIPLKRLATPYSEKDIPKSNRFEGDSLEAQEKRFLLRNRSHDLLEQNFAGVPYIAEGNRLVYV